MKNKNFKEGDWCFSNFELCQIQKMDGDEVEEVSTGVIRRTGWYLTDSCFHLDMKIKNISDTFSYWHDRLHAVKSVNLNYPDIMRSLESRWEDACNKANNVKYTEEVYNNLSRFCNSIIQKAEDLQEESVEGISLIRR